MEKVHWSSQFDQIFYFLTLTAILGADGQLMWNVNKQNDFVTASKGKKKKFCPNYKITRFYQVNNKLSLLGPWANARGQKWTRSRRAIGGVAKEVPDTAARADAI